MTEPRKLIRGFTEKSGGTEIIPRQGKIFLDEQAGLCYNITVDKGSSPRGLPAGSCGCSSVVELQPSKLVVWVRFPSPAPKPQEGKYNRGPRGAPNMRQ